MGNYELILLEPDAPAQAVGYYFERDLKRKIKHAKIKEPKNYKCKEIDPLGRIIDVTMNKKEDVLESITEALGKSAQKRIVMYGSGDYHHYTYGLCRLADALSEEYGYVHLDHHSDDYPSSSKGINCGSFVNYILEDTNAAKALLIGEYPNPRTTNQLGHGLFDAITESGLRDKNGSRELDKKLSKLPDDVYLTFDLDVMDYDEITTGFDQGTLKRKELLDVISAIKASKNIISADILGFEFRDFAVFFQGGQKTCRLTDCEKLYAEIADRIMGKIK